LPLEEGAANVMRTNRVSVNPKDFDTAPTTYEGGKAAVVGVYEQLRRSVLACLLWENTFYESGVEITERIKNLVGLNDTESVADLAVEARKTMNLRHVPLWLIVSMLAEKRHRAAVGNLIPRVISRPDEMGELLSLYWKNSGKVPLANQLKKGLSKCFDLFGEYSFAKNDSKKSAVRLRDVMFLTHPKPKTKEKEELFKRIANDEMETPDTWEVALSSGASKRETFERLMKEKKLGALAFLRNLRNMKESGVSEELVKEYFSTVDFSKVFPFRFISAANAVPEWKKFIEPAMLERARKMEKLSGKTIVLLDVSGSMFNNVSDRSELDRIDMANGLAIILREICEDIEIYTFSDRIASVKPNRGFELAHSIRTSQEHRSTYLGKAISWLNINSRADRLVILTDEQAGDNVPAPKFEKPYIIDVASYRYGVDYDNYVHINGFSEAVVLYLIEYEKFMRNAG